MSNKIPSAKKIRCEYEIHDQLVIDDYSWLRDKNWPNVTDKDVLSYLTEENNYSARFFDANTDLAQEIFDEIKGRVKLEDSTLPVRDGDYFYYSRTEENKEYKIYCRKHKSLEALEEVILDVNQLAFGHKFTAISTVAVTHDGRYIAYAVDFNGSERFDIYIYDLVEQLLLKDKVVNTIGNIVWAKGNQGFFYTPVDEQWRHNEVKYHVLGENVANDISIFIEHNDLFMVNIYATSNHEYVVIDSRGHNSSEIYIMDLKNTLSIVTKLCERIDGVLYNVEHSQENFFIHTNSNDTSFHIFKVDVNSYANKDLWYDYVVASDRYLESFVISKSYIVLNYRYMSNDIIVIKHLLTNLEKEVKFAKVAENSVLSKIEMDSYSARAFVGNYDDDDIRIIYDSLKNPEITYAYNFESSELTMLKQEIVASGFNADNYVAKKIWASDNGIKIPITVFYNKDMFKKNGPLYLYGYGSYGIAIPVKFRRTVISLVDRGVTFAIAHIRGGDDMGFDWYEQSKFLNKKNTFNDFIACAERLIDCGYTSRGQIAIEGGSAGGMLMGYVINNRPELFRSAILAVPFVDVLNTMLDETLPLTPGEFKEWGNPKDKDVFDYMLSYSPYENIKLQQYPHIFVSTGINDPRVGYWEAAKFVAKLRDVKLQTNDDHALYMKIDMQSGHRGASGRFEYIKEIAQEYVFILKMFDDIEHS